MSPPADESSVLFDGPWNHRFVSANGSRFHVVEAGTGPMVLFLHGFPEFWWAWQHQLRIVAGAGFRAVAIDLRGYGASDKPPRGYDLTTLSADVAGMIRALGEHDAMIAGQGWGGLLGWTTSDPFETLHVTVRWHLENPPPEASADFEADDRALASPSP